MSCVFGYGNGSSLITSIPPALFRRPQAVVIAESVYVRGGLGNRMKEEKPNPRMRDRLRVFIVPIIYHRTNL